MSLTRAGRAGWPARARARRNLVTSHISARATDFSSNGHSNSDARNAFCRIFCAMHRRAWGLVLTHLRLDTRHSFMLLAEPSHSSLTQASLASVSKG